MAARTVRLFGISATYDTVQIVRTKERDMRENKWTTNLLSQRLGACILSAAVISSVRSVLLEFFPGDAWVPGASIALMFFAVIASYQLSRRIPDSECDSFIVSVRSNGGKRVILFVFLAVVYGVTRGIGFVSVLPPVIELILNWLSLLILCMLVFTVGVCRAQPAG